MIQTMRLGLYKPQVSDDVQDTINRLADNFQTLDDNFDETISNIESFLTIGAIYEVGKKYWNRSAYLGGFVGWVNTRTGVYAPVWKPQTTYVAGDKMTALYDNGHYFECIVGGTSAINHPALSTVAGDITYDINGHTLWTASYVYDLNDIVIKTNGDMTYYYKCIIAGTSGTTEPAWTDIEGTTIIDGSVHWYVYKTVQWKEKGTSCFFTPFGEIGTTIKTNIFEQVTPSNKWVVVHNLGKFPQVTIIDSVGDVVYGDVRYIDNDTLEVTFSKSITGKCYLN